MAPPKLHRGLNKHPPRISDVSLGNGEDISKKNIQRKRKLSDMLGPQWSKEELERFYNAYRKYNRNWKKVAVAVRNRSVDMVETLYNMNRAYLSLPEGTASVAGLIAMMTDHYSNLVGNEIDQESNEGGGTSQKPSKRARFKVQPSIYKKSDLNSPTAASSNDCLAVLRSRWPEGCQTRVVGKRTPRFLVSRSNENLHGKKYTSLNRQDLKINVDAHDDKVACAVALALAEASQRGGSPQVSQIPNHGSMEAETEELSSCRNSLMEPRSVDRAMQKDRRIYDSLMEPRSVDRAMRKDRRIYEEKLEAEESGGYSFHDIGEVCNGIEGQRVGSARKKHDMEVLNERVSKTSSLGLRKRSNKVLFQSDEGSTFDALHTLAELSLMVPATKNENGIEVAFSKTPKHLGVSCDAIAVPETKQARKTPKKLVSKMPATEAHLSNSLSESQESEAKEAPKKLNTKGKRCSRNPSPKLMKNQEHSTSADLGTNPSDSAQSITKVSASDQVTLCTKGRSRRKIELKKPQREKSLKLPNKILDDRNNTPSSAINDKVFNFKKRLSNCLSDNRVRRWCMFEWFYSTIDYPWFAKKEFVEYLHHVGLGNVPRLTRVEWGVIRSSLGKPRRFSEQFLKEEKEKLNQYRESVRALYTELREGARDGLPTDLARPLSVGQRVIAIHPKTMEIHDGSVLTVDHSCCRIQFDRPDLGVEFVKDVDCMPLNPYENMPALVTKHIDTLDMSFENAPEGKVRGQSNERVKFSSEILENSAGFLHLSPPNNAINILLTQAKVPTSNADWKENIGTMEPTTTYSKPSKVVQHQGKEADVRALSELMYALDKKAAVISEWRLMHDDVLENQKSGDCSLMDSEPFKKQYATIVLQLKEVNEQVSSALFHLRQRNAYQDNLSPKPIDNFCDSGDIVNACDHFTSHTHEPSLHVNETIESSIIKARTMVDSALKDGMGNTTENVLDATDNPAVAPNSTLKNGLNKNEADIPSELISQCVATFLMIQKCTEREFPPAGVAKILDSAVARLQPRCSQNLQVYTDIQKCIGVIKNQILALVPT